jgi:hypothetical protein
VLAIDYEIQQNSDTTYQIVRWNQADSMANRGPCMTDESLQSILWGDFLAPGAPAGNDSWKIFLFLVNRLEIDAPRDA